MSDLSRPRGDPNADRLRRSPGRRAHPGRRAARPVRPPRHGARPEPCSGVGRASHGDLERPPCNVQRPDGRERRIRAGPASRELHPHGEGVRLRGGVAGAGRVGRGQRHARVRAGVGAVWGIGHRQRLGRLSGGRDQQRHQDAHGPARPAPVRHRDHEGAHPRPAHAEHRRRDALHPRHPGAPGREQSRPGRHPRQQLFGRLLPERRARRRAVLPGPLQRRAHRSPEGPERHDVRSWRRRRSREPGDEGGPLPAPARRHHAGRRIRAQADRGRPGPAADRQGRLPPQRHVRELGQLPRLRRPGALRAKPHPDPRLRLPHPDHPRLRASPRHARRGSRHHVLPGTARRRRRLDLLRQSRGQPRAGGRRPRHRHRRAQGGEPHAAQPHHVRRLRPLLPELRAGRRHPGQEPRGSLRLQQRDAAPERLQPDGPDLHARHRPA